MAARTKRITHDQKTRAKIQTSQLMNRLTDHVLGKCEMTATQVTAALGLIKKTLPDLSAVEMQQEITERKSVSAQPMELKDWQSEYGADDEADRAH